MVGGNLPPGFWLVSANLYQFVELGWMLLLTSLAIAAVQKIRGWQASVLGISCLEILMTVMLVFIR